MTTYDPEPRLNALTAACARIGANLLELETHPTVELLGASQLRGETAKAWDAASRKIAGLFAAREALRAVLDQARRITRKLVLTPGRCAELWSLLEGPSILVSGDPVGFTGRALTSATRATTRSTPDQLIVRMTADYDAAKSVVVRVDAVWSEILPALREARRREVELTAACEESGPIRALLNEVGDRLRELSEAILTDPLSVDVARLGDVVLSLDRVDSELADIRNLRECWNEHIAGARQLLSDARAVGDECEAAVHMTRSRIVLDRPVESVLLPSRLHDELERIVEQGGDVVQTAARLARWRAEVGAWRAAAERTRSSCQALLGERDELRARLDAYHAKAAATGQLEWTTLAEHHECARALLYTAPTDLGRARRAVAEYQHLLASRGTDTEAVRS